MAIWGLIVLFDYIAKLDYKTFFLYLSLIPWVRIEFELVVKSLNGNEYNFQWNGWPDTMQFSHNSLAVIDLQSSICPALKLGKTCRALNKSFSSIQSLLLHRIKDIEYLG